MANGTYPCRPETIYKRGQFTGASPSFVREQEQGYQIREKSHGQIIFASWPNRPYWFLFSARFRPNLIIFVMATYKYNLYK